MEESGQWLFKSPGNDSDTVPWNNLCPNSEGWGPFSTIRVPDFTPCFEESVVLLIPAAYLIVFGMARVWVLTKRENLSSDLTYNWLYFAKMVINRRRRGKGV
ncbi:hypothetical protein BC941DRAFT_139243 [Chlamydoabsidia padenii]|nr:hypothetical protein BC941DRAFT_139243 [Chlamydoabsidia padenii]